MTGSPTSRQTTHHPGRAWRTACARGVAIVTVLAGMSIAPGAAGASQTMVPAAVASAAVAAPTGLTGLPGDRQVRLTWAPTPGAVSYRLFRDYNLVGYPSSASFTDTGLANGTGYRYYVRAVSSSGAISAASAAVTVTPAGSILAAPTSLNAAAGDSKVTLTWTAGQGAASYRLFRNYDLIGYPTTTEATDTGLANGVTYRYYVRSVSAAGVISDVSSTVSATPVATPAAPAVPSAPAGLAAVASDRSVKLTWTATSGATSYTVLRGGTKVATVTSPAFADSGLVNGTAYTYTVQAVNAAGTSPASASASATPVTVLAVPSAPAGLAAVASDRSVKLTWTATSGATSYNVLRGGTKVATVTSPAFADSGLVNGTAYTYAVQAVNTAGASPDSASVSATPVATIPAPSTGPAPTRLAWFYKPPSSADESVVLREFDTYVLTKGDETFVSNVRAAQPNAKILQYFLLNQVVKPDAGAVEWRNNAANQPGDFADLMANHYDWFLKDTQGNPIKDSAGKFYMMDPGNDEWRSYWLSKFKESNAGWDGLFLDNVDLSLISVERYGVRARDYSTDAAFTDALAGFLNRIHNEYAVPTGKPVSGNLVNGSSSRTGLPKYMSSMDGYMEEAFAADWHTGYLPASSWNAQLARVDSFTSQGKSALLVTQGDSQSDTARQRFTFASYLLVSGPTVSYRYTSSGSYRSPWIYDNYASQLGAPVGPRRTLSDGSVRRDFERGYVVVNPSTKGVSIVTR